MGGSPVSNVDFKKWPCPLSLFWQFSCRYQNGPMSHVDFKKHPMSCRLFSFLMSLGSMSYVDFKKWPCRLVEFRGQEPQRASIGALLGETP